MNFEDFQLLEDRHHEEYSSEMMRIFKLKHTPKTITFQVTEDCCLSCVYCYQHAKKKTHMTPEIGHAAIDWLLASTPENNPYINPENSPAIIIDFIGGEPLMEIDLIEDLICYCKSRKIE